MAEACRRRFDSVLVWKIDRFGRSLRHLVNALAELGVSFVFQHTQQGLPVRAPPLEKAHPLLGASRIRAKYQSGGELHASGSSWSKELVAHRQPTSGTEGCSDSLGRGKLPQVESPSARLLFDDSPRACRSPDQVPSRPYSRCVDRAGTFVFNGMASASAVIRRA